MKAIALVAASLGLAITATPAFAEEVSVGISDLNLETPEGQKTLDERIDRAARSVCGLDDIRTGTRIRSASSRECYAKARASAERQVAAMIKNQARGG